MISKPKKLKKKTKLKKLKALKKHICHGVQGGAEVYCPECGKVLYA